MKKILLSFSFLCLCLFLFSFSPSNNNVSYADVIEGKEFTVKKELGSFSEFENTRYTSDKTEWNHRRKNWTDFSKVADLNSIEKAINNH